MNTLFVSALGSIAYYFVSNAVAVGISTLQGMFNGYNPIEALMGGLGLFLARLFSWQPVFVLILASISFLLFSRGIWRVATLTPALFLGLVIHFLQRDIGLRPLWSALRISIEPGRTGLGYGLELLLAGGVAAIFCSVLLRHFSDT